jgi:nucleotidyltransferase substrate binding protein (TIGR01987 family)
MEKIELAVGSYSDALQKLLEGIEEADDELGRDGVIQRFEFTFELFWKTLKIILNREGILCNILCKTPRSCIKDGFKNGVVVTDEVYLDMLNDRNLSSHIYDAATSKEIYERVKKKYGKKLEEAADAFKKYIKSQKEDNRKAENNN